MLAHEEKTSVGITGYFIVFVILLFLLALTLWLYTLGLAGAPATLAALSIAALKAFLVALYFMHARFASKVTWVFAGAGILWLGIMFTLTITDYLTRGWTPRDESLRPTPFLPPPPLILPPLSPPLSPLVPARLPLGSAYAHPAGKKW